MSPALAQNFSANQVKGVYYYKITKFVTWKTPQVKLCFMGEKEDKGGETLAKTVQALVAKDKETKFTIVADINIKDIKTCHMLFIGSKSEPNLQDILAVLGEKPIVTISDIDGFPRRGGMFALSDQAGKIDVALNYQNAKERKIDLSTDLLEMITVVD